MTPWVKRVYDVVCSIPKGRTLGYAQVAMRAGKPGAARAVVRALHAMKGAPWWRVTRSDRTLAKEIAAQQRKKLLAEGVKFERARVPLKSRWV